MGLAYHCTLVLLKSDTMSKPIRFFLSYAVSILIALSMTYCTNQQLQATDFLTKSLFNFVAIRFCIAIHTGFTTGNWGATL